MSFAPEPGYCGTTGNFALPFIIRGYIFCPVITNLQAEIQGTDVALTWSASEGDPLGYDIFRGNIKEGTTTATEYLVKNLPAGNNVLGVEAFYDDGCMPVRITKAVQIKTNSPVTNLDGKCYNSVLTLTWSKPDGENIGKYVIYQDDIKFAETTATTFTQGGMEGKHTYCIVAVYDDGAQSEKVCKTITCEFCNPVTDVSAIIRNCKSATVTWMPVAEAKEYKISRTGMESVIIIAPPYTEISDFEEGKTYIWNIVSVCNSGESDKVSVSASCGLCDPVTNASAGIAVDCKSATVTWMPVSGAKEYKISRIGVETVIVTSTPYSEEFDFEDGKTYTWEIVSVCNSGESEKIPISATGCGTNINDISTGSMSVQVYPNPGNDKLTIAIAFGDFTFRMYDITGKLVLEQKNQKNITTKHLPSGLYLYRIFSNNQAITLGKWVRK
jgi:hypothetical protein